MDSKDTQSNTKDQLDSINSNNIFRGLKSVYFFKNLLNLLSRKKLLELVKCNKSWQKIMDINLNDYKIYHEIYTSIELEMIPNKQGIHGEFINIKDEDKKYYHIYFNDNKKEEIKRYELNENNNVSKIDIIIDHQVKSFSGLFKYSTCSSIKFKNFIELM